VDIETGRARSVRLAVDPASSVQNISIDAAADRALIATQDRRAVMHSTLYDLTTGRVLGSFAETGIPSAHNTDVGAIAPDGRTAAFATAPHQMAVVELPSGRRLRVFDIHFTGQAADRHWVSPLQFAPDGRLLVMGFDTVNSDPDAGPENQLVGIVDVMAGRLDGQVGGLGELGFPTAWGWSKDGSLLAVGSAAGQIRVVNARRLAPISQPVVASVGEVVSVAFSPDGTTLVTGGADGRLSFWDSHTLQPIGQPVRAPRDDAWWAAYRSDGSVVGLEPAAADGTAQWFTMPARPADWTAAACHFAGGGLTRAEWSRYVGAAHAFEQLC
jgi:WD40 repeat protein